jgi:hypothetical protein
MEFEVRRAHSIEVDTQLQFLHRRQSFTHASKAVCQERTSFVCRFHEPFVPPAHEFRPALAPPSPAVVFAQ